MKNKYTFNLQTTIDFSNWTKDMGIKDYILEIVETVYNSFIPFICGMLVITNSVWFIIPFLVTAMFRLELNKSKDFSAKVRRRRK